LTVPIQQTIAPSTSQYFSVFLTQDENQFLQTTVTVLNNKTALPRGDDNATVTVDLRRQAAPTGDLVDATSYVDSDGAYTVELDSPIPNTVYYIRVTNNGNTALDYQLDSLAHGCKDGFGPNCTTNTVDLTNNNNATLVTGTGDYQYFFVRHTTLIVGVGREKLEVPAPTLLASIWNYPSNGSAINVQSNKTVGFISAHIPNFVASDTWYVSVWANEGEEYYIWANSPCPNMCAGSSGNVTHGVCDVNSGMCDCDKGYGNLFCDKTGLKLVWIIIIVIVCAIILAIAIGVPVACFLRNRRRARYERV
jgi:hypothetical protein